MPFKQGNTLSSGRPKGASNKSTEVVKRAVANLLENNLDNVQLDLDKMKPKDKGSNNFTITKISYSNPKGS